MSRARVAVAGEDDVGVEVAEAVKGADRLVVVVVELGGSVGVRRLHSNHTEHDLRAMRDVLHAVVGRRSARSAAAGE